MGTPIALKLAQENFLVTAYNRTADKLNPLEEQGLTVTTNPQTAIANSDYLILTLSDAAAIQTVLLEKRRYFFYRENNYPDGDDCSRRK